MSGFKVSTPSIDEMLENCDIHSDGFGSEGEEDFVDAVEASNEGSASGDVEEVRRVEELREDDSEVWVNLEEALASKAEGNAHYVKGEYQDALDCYSRAIAMCPGDDGHREQMAIFYGNRAACFSALKELDAVIEDCTEALERNDKYIKVLARRAAAYEQIEKYDEALVDLKRILELEPETGRHPKVVVDVARLTKLHEAKMEKMKEEAMGKLKDLGNSILGNFGMSLDDFKMQQDPNTGSWSMSMGQQGQPPQK